MGKPDKQFNNLLFQDLMENSKEAFLIWEASTGQCILNQSCQDLLEVSDAVPISFDSFIIDRLGTSDQARLRAKFSKTAPELSFMEQQFDFKLPSGVPKRIWVKVLKGFAESQGSDFKLALLIDLTEIFDAEATLSSIKWQQQAILDNIPFLAWLKDKEGKFISVNQPFAELYGYQPHEMIGLSDFDILPEERALHYRNIDLEIQNSGKRQQMEDVNELEDGIRWSETYKSPIFDAQGKIIGITGISRDITDRKEMEVAMLKNEEHFRSLLQYSSDAITILDQEGMIIFESSLQNRILNFSVDELVGKPFREIIHPDDKELYESTLREVLSQPEVQIKREYRSLHKNKKWIYVESIFTNHLKNPSICGIVVNTRDVSDRKMAELKERVYHDNLIFLSNSALDLLSLVDRDDIIKYIAEKLNNFLEHSVIIVSTYLENEDQFEVKKIVGLEDYQSELTALFREDPIGFRYSKEQAFIRVENPGEVNTFKGAVSDLDLKRLDKNRLTRFFQKININKVYNITLARHSKLLGNITILTLNKSIIKFKHIIETFVHQVAVALHRSQLEYELVQAKLKAEESDRLKTAFLANMSHEIRTPMNGILGFAEMLNDNKLADADRQKYIDIINNNGKILINLIDDIIDFSQIEAGQLKIEEKTFSLNSMLGQVHASFQTQSLKKEKPQVKLKMNKGFEDDKSYIVSDPNRLRQVITNLVGNAFKFTNKGFIEFGYDQIKNDLRFYVKDTGIGIPPEKIDQIFERFVQADNSRSRKFSGSGLGLAISKGFIELLGGKMWAESEINKGSIFYFTIPFQKAEVAIKVEEKATPAKSNYDWSDKTFLVAEDDFFSYKFLEGFLKQTNASVLHADDGAKAVQLCAENDSIDLVLMDVQMPEMNGLDATRTIKETNKTLPIIAQTANAISEEKQKCFEAGFDDFVPKPINIADLFLKIDFWLSKSK